MKKNKNYFGLDEEQAVREFISTECVDERTRIYRERLKYSVDKLVENIINRYKLHRIGYTYEENHTDTVSHLICQSGKFKPAKGKKAYSYFGTICKNYLIGEITKHNKKRNIHHDYDEYSEMLEENEELSYYIEDESLNINKIIERLVNEIKKIIADPVKNKLNDNEVKIGYALIEIFTNYEKLTELDSEITNSKYDKNTILRTIRNYTNMTTKDIRTSLAKYKVIYKMFKEDDIQNGSN